MANSGHREVAPLSLIPDDEVGGETKNTTNQMSFKLKASPGNANVTTKYTFNMMKVDGTQTLRQHIKWTLDLQQVYDGMELASAVDRRRLAEQMCSGVFKAAYTACIESSIKVRWSADTSAVVNALVQDVACNETNEEFVAGKLVVANGIPKPDVTCFREP
jgi:hypothetical protein